MKEHPIPYTSQMILARRRGWKTNTRRIVKLPVGYTLPDFPNHFKDAIPRWMACRSAGAAGPEFKWIRCPYGSTGDRLWTREAWRTHLGYDSLPPRELPVGTSIWYEADGYGQIDECGRYRPPMFMPRCMSRGLDEVVAVRIERLHDISEADALAEGCIRLKASGRVTDVVGGQYGGRVWPCARDWYMDLWSRINGVASLEANPWVWRIQFRVIV